MANFLADGVSMTGREIRTLNGEFGGGNGLSLDVVKELQVITNGFKAETGQTGAGTISVITKSGTNTLSGSGYGFWRPTDLVAANLLNGASTTQSRSQYGGTIGGPIKRDVTHYFANYEGTSINDASVVTSVLAPGTFPAPQTQRQGFFKVDHRFNDHNALDVRYNFNRNTQEAQSVGGLNTYDRRTNTVGRTDGFVTSLLSNFGSNKVNEARFRYTFDTVDFYSPLTASSGAASRTPDFSSVPVSVVYTGVGNAGTNPSYPQNLVEKRAQWVDQFSVVRGAHQFKSGVDVIGSWRFVTLFNNFPGTYTFAQGAKYPFNASDPATFPFQYTQTFGISGLNFKDALIGLFTQDDWEVRRGLTLNLGVRWDKDSLFQGDNNNFAPRVGFAWNPDGDAKTVIRGGTGIFYDTLESSLINRESNTGPVGQTTIDLRQGDPLFPTFPNRLSAFPTGAGTVPRALVYVPIFQGADFPLGIGDQFHRIAPHFFNTNLGVQHELSTNWALSADYTRVYGYDLLTTFDINAPPYFALGPGQTRTLAQADRLRPLGSPNTTGGPYGIDFTGFRTLYLQYNGGSTQYNAVKFALTKRLSQSYSLQANYTLGRAQGDVDNFRAANSFVPGLTTIGGDRSYQFGPSDTDVRHVFVVNGTYLAPHGLRVGAILFARSGFPYTGVVGTDANGDGFTSNGSFGDRAGLAHAQLVPLSVAAHVRHQPGVRPEARGLTCRGAAVRRVQSGEQEEHHHREQHRRARPEQSTGDIRHGHRRRGAAPGADRGALPVLKTTDRLARSRDLPGVLGRCDPDERLIVAAGFVVAVQIERGSRGAEQGLGILGPCREGGAIAVQRPLRVARSQVAGRQLVMGLCVRRIPFERLT